MSDVPLIVFDLDGVIQFDDDVPAAAVSAVDAVRATGAAVRFLTNNGIDSRRSRIRPLAAAGLDVEPAHLYTTSRLAARYVADRALEPILPLFGGAADEEFAGIARTEGADARAVVVGDWFPHYDYARLRAAHAALERGATLVAMHRKRWWPTRGTRVIDIGFWVAGLEYCAGCEAVVVGKPAAYSYDTVVADVGASSRVVMVADEEEPDLAGARAAGLETVRFAFAGARPTDADFERLVEALRLD